MSKRIAIDMDEVMADPIARFQKWYHRDFGEYIPAKDIENKRFPSGVPPERKEYVFQYLNTKGFFADLPVIEDSQRVIKKLIDNRFEIFVATAAMEFKSSFEDKYAWLEEHFPFIHWRNYVYCGDKSIIHADYLIDDSPHQLEAFTGKGLLFHAHHNLTETRFKRVHNWREVEQYFFGG